MKVFPLWHRPTCNECYSSPASRRIHLWSTNGAPCLVSQPSAGDQAGSPHNCPLQYDQLEIHIYLLDIVYIWSTDWCTQYTDSIAMGQTMEIRLTLFLCWGPARDSLEKPQPVLDPPHCLRVFIPCTIGGVIGVEDIYHLQQLTHHHRRLQRHKPLHCRRIQYHPQHQAKRWERGKNATVSYFKCLHKTT